MKLQVMQQMIKLVCFQLKDRCQEIHFHFHILLFFQIETPSGTLGPFCGHTPPPSPLLTHSHNVKVRFTTDSFGTNKGFSFRFGARGADKILTPARSKKMET